MSVNISKNKVIVFNKSERMVKDYKFSMDKIGMIQFYCYLGIDILASGSFGQAIFNLNNKARKTVFPLIDIMVKFDLKITKSMDLFHRLIGQSCYMDVKYRQPLHSIT